MNVFDCEMELASQHEAQLVQLLILAGCTQEEIRAAYQVIERQQRVN